MSKQYNDVIKLTKEEIERCIKDFDKIDKLKNDEAAVKKVFEKLSNNKIEEVLPKVIVLNDRYGTQLHSNELSPKNDSGQKTNRKIVFDVQTISKIIIDTEFAGLKNDCKTIRNWIVDTIKYISKKYPQYRIPYSFLSKYSAWSFQEQSIPILDSFAKGMLYELNEHSKFYKSSIIKSKMNDYNYYCEIYDDFVNHVKTKIGEYSYKNIDKYLWFYGKYRLLLNAKNSIDIRIY